MLTVKQEYSEHKYSSTPLEWITMDTNIAYWLHTSSNVTLTQSYTHWHTNRMYIVWFCVSGSDTPDWQPSVLVLGQHGPAGLSALSSCVSGEEEAGLQRLT